MNTNIQVSYIKVEQYILAILNSFGELYWAHLFVLLIIWRFIFTPIAKIYVIYTHEMLN